MASYSNFYSGMDNGLDPDYGSPISHYVPFSQIGTAVNVQTANQLKAVSDALNTGAKVVEVQMTFPDVEKAIPTQHLEELNRLRKLTGVELTLHGPLIEPTGIDPRGGGWDEFKREQAEKQMWGALERGRKINPDGNIVVTFHASNISLDPETKVMTKDGETTTNLAVINERTGEFGALPKPKADYLLGGKAEAHEELDRLNKERWARELSSVNIAASRGHDEIERAKLKLRDEKNSLGTLKEKDLTELYKLTKSEEGQKLIDSLPAEAQTTINNLVNDIGYGDIFVRDAYTSFKELYNQAYEVAEREKNQEDLQKLDALKNEIAPVVKDYEKDASKITDLEKGVTKGIRVLNSIKTPEVFKPIKEFAVDKASDTFSNLAFEAYDKFRDKAPIISIENPPIGLGLARAEDIKAVIETSQRKFIEKAKEKGLSESEARRQAEKLIGATWDVGHINLLRKYGYGEKELKEQTKTIAPFIKHVHLSDNFGFEHSELPMGMGNVPMKAHEELIKEYGKKVNQIKRVIEAGDWVQHFQSPAFTQTLAAYGSPVYPMQMGPYWNQTSGITGSYSVGQGNILPDINFQTYGSGFSSLPPELGGQLSGRSRFSGAPTE